MTLRTKTLLFMAVPFAVFLGVVYLAAQFIVLSGFNEQERLSTDKDISRVFSYMDDKTMQLNNAARDWASWDETYRFMADHNQAFMVANLLTDETYINNRLSFMAVLDTSGKMVYQKGFDLQSRRVASLPAGLLAHLVPGDPLLNLPTTESSVSGLLLLPPGPVLVAAQPIVTSERKGPSRGTLIWGRLLNDDEIERMEDTILVSVRLYSTTDPALPKAAQAPPTALSASGGLVNMAPGDQDTMVAYTTLKDIAGQPAVTLEVTRPREIFALGQRTFGYTFFALVVAGLLFGVLMLIIVEKFVLDRVVRLSREVTQISDDPMPGIGVSVTGRDELTSLAVNINRMLQAQEALHAQVERDRERLKALSDLDSLTSVLNRRSFQALGEALLQANAAKGTTAAMVFLDLDHFKTVNDRYGHTIGDQLLTGVGALLGNLCKSDDLVARVGGDEFAVLLSSVSEAEATRMAQQFLQLFPNQMVQFAPQLAGNTCSIGLALFPESGETWAELLNTADRAMYQVKQRGGGGYQVWRPEANSSEGSIVVAPA